MQPLVGVTIQAVTLPPCQQASKLVLQDGGAMKTTLDLPDHLMQQVKQRALQQGRPIKALMADYIRQGLHGPAALPLTTNSGVLEVDEEGLPLYRPDPQLKRHPIDVATALRLEQDALKQEDRQRAGLPLNSLDQDLREFERQGLTF